VLDRFILAVEAGNCSQIVECAPPSTTVSISKERLVAGCRQQLKSLKDTIKILLKNKNNSFVSIDKNTAVLALEHGQVKFQKSDGRWYIEDFFIPGHKVNPH
jgi:hypothetical protein